MCLAVATASRRMSLTVLSAKREPRSPFLRHRNCTEGRDLATPRERPVDGLTQSYVKNYGSLEGGAPLHIKKAVTPWLSLHEPVAGIVLRFQDWTRRTWSTQCQLPSATNEIRLLSGMQTVIPWPVRLPWFPTSRGTGYNPPSTDADATSSGNVMAPPRQTAGAEARQMPLVVESAPGYHTCVTVKQQVSGAHRQRMCQGRV